MSIRQEKVGNLLKRELSEILRVEGGNITNRKMVTVTTVRPSPDLGFAKIYVSIFPSIDSDEDVKALRSRSSFIRGLLGKKVGKQLRVVPEIAFYLDDSL